MARTHDGPALDLDQAAALRRLVAAFGAEQVTVTHLQPIEPAPAPNRRAGMAGDAA
jgi:hypothetical protein